MPHYLFLEGSTGQVDNPIMEYKGQKLMDPVKRKIAPATTKIIPKVEDMATVPVNNTPAIMAAPNIRIIRSMFPTFLIMLLEFNS